jgi:hypothetical protein
MNLLMSAADATAGASHLDGTALSLISSMPFAGLLLSIALLQIIWLRV